MQLVGWANEGRYLGLCQDELTLHLRLHWRHCFSPSAFARYHHGCLDVDILTWYLQRRKLNARVETLSETCADPLQTSHIGNIVCYLTFWRWNYFFNFSTPCI